MNPRIFEMCDYISEHAPNARISISTNGSRLTPEIIQKILKIKTLFHMNFSVYAGTKETYEELMGLDFSTIDRIEEAIDALLTHRPEVRLCVGYTTDTRFVKPEDIEEVKRRFSTYEHRGCRVSAHPVSFNSQHGMNMRTCPDNKPCTTVFASVVVYSDGRVGLCCFDVEGELTIGNVNEMFLQDAIYSDLAQKYRNVHLLGMKDVIPLCRSCTQPN